LRCLVPPFTFALSNLKKRIRIKIITDMEMNKTLASSGGRITVIDALRGFSLIGICLIHGAFWRYGDDGSPSHVPLGRDAG